MVILQYEGGGCIVKRYSRYYVIAGYDLTGMKTDKFEEWRYTEEGEEYLGIDSKQKNYYHFFEDMTYDTCEFYLYFGHILSVLDEHKFNTDMFDMTQIEVFSNRMKTELKSFQEDGIIKEGNPPFKIILLEECVRLKDEYEKVFEGHVLSF